MDLQLGGLCDGLDGFHQFQHASANIGVNFGKAYPHAWAKRILVCLGTDPCDHALGRQPFCRILWQRKFKRELGANRERAVAFYKEPASADATGAAFKPVPLRSLVFDAKRERHTRLIPGLPARGGLR